MAVVQPSQDRCYLSARLADTNTNSNSRSHSNIDGFNGVVIMVVVLSTSQQM